MLKIKTGNVLVREQTRKLIRGGCCEDTASNWKKEIDVDGNSPLKLIRERENGGCDTCIGLML